MNWVKPKLGLVEYNGSLKVHSSLVNVIVPVLVVAGTGFALGRVFPLDGSTISKIALNALTPALCLHVLLTTEVSGQVGVTLVVAYVLVSLIGAVVLSLVLLALGACWSPARRALRATVR